MSGRIFAIGDIHGCDLAFDLLLSLIQPGPEDTLIVLGDVVDRGPNSRNCMDILMHLREDCKLVFLKGNHEEMMLNAIDQGVPGSSWMMYGGESTIWSYGGSVEGIPPMHLDFLSEGLRWHETETEIFVHAGVNPGRSLDEQSDHDLLWRHMTGYEEPHISGKRIVCGHTALHGGLPMVRPGWVCIDTFAFGGLFLTALNVETNEFLQTTQSGQSRQGLRLEDLI